MIYAPGLEGATLVLGITVLLIDAFAERLDKRIFGYVGLVGLLAIFVATFFVAPESTIDHAPLWNFYSADTLAIFFKRIALVTTAVVLLMVIDFAPSLHGSIEGATPQAGLGEFLAISIFFCAGLMWLAWALDSVLIFFSFESFRF